jgi:hypothetical protein
MRRIFACICLFSSGLLLFACGSGPKGPPAWNPNGDPPRDENYHGGPNAILLKYDANHDGTLTRDELIAGLKADFAAYDTKKSGCLDDTQVATINAERVATDQSTATPLQDWNQDGCVNFQEFSAVPASLFDELDRNHDGKITPQEFGPRGGRGQAEQGRGGGRRGGRGEAGP